MPIQVTDLIHSSFRLIGAIAAGETLETNELNDAFVSLNQMIYLWDTEGASLASRQRLLVNVTPFAGIYMLPQRPVRIEAASVAQGGIDSPVQIVDSQGWEAVIEKGATSMYTRTLYCDYGYPTSQIFIAPIPRMTGTLELILYATMLQFATVNDTIDLPPGYEMALRYNFAVALLPEYPRSQPDPTLVAQAQAYKASIQQLNAQNHMRSQMNSAAQSAAVDAAQTVAR